MTTSTLAVFVAEDEPLIAMMLEDFLDELGYRAIVTVDNVDDGLVQAGAVRCDVAVLDVHLRGRAVWPIADLLADRGVPILLATGGQSEPPPERHAGVAVLAKPYTIAGIDAALRRVVESAT